MADSDSRIPGLPGLTVDDFWAWAYSDILHNLVRPVFAEFVVGHLLGALGEQRLGWDAVDLRYRDRGIEVKSAAYLQSWKQTTLSRISFDIARKKGWDAVTNVSLQEATRSADCYVFCLYPERDPTKADPLRVPDWNFYVAATSLIDEHFESQKSVALSRVVTVAEEANHENLRAAVDRALGV